MNELIKIEINENNEQVVSGRELHEFLKVKTKYVDWIEKKIKKYGFIENRDFVLVSEKRETNNPRNPYTEITEHLLKMSMAKEISMTENNERGRQARLYFIQCEEAWNNDDMVLVRALQIQNKKILGYTEKIQLLENTIKEQQPKVDFYNDVTGSDTTAEIATVAKILNFKNIGRNTLFDILRRQGILQRDNMPFQTYVDRGYFRVVESKWNAPNGDVKVNYKTVVYQKGIEYISKILRDLGYEKVGGMLN